MEVLSPYHENILALYEDRGSDRVESMKMPSRDKSISPMWGDFWFLDTNGPIVLIPWSNGGYIVHFSGGASPYTVPLLQGSTYWSFVWQNEEAVLWAVNGRHRQLRAYNLWDLGLSGFPEVPFWELDTSDGWEVHPERGAVRIVRGDDAYRIEHAWREPWTLLEERRLSGWIPGSPPPRSRVLVSPNGRHAVVLETYVPEDGEDGEPALPRNQARQVRMTLQPLQPPVPASDLPADGNEGERPREPPDG